MDTMLKMSRWLLLIMATAGLALFSSCGDGDGDDDPEPVIPPSNLVYAASTVELGSEGTITPTIDGDAATFAITDAGDAEDFVTINVNTGALTIAAESELGEYSVEVTATNSEGSTSATASITIEISEDFDPRGKTMLWQYFINQSEDLTLTGLQGELLGDLGLPFDELTLPVGWPTAETPVEEVPLYFLLTELEKLIFQVPGDEACSAAGGNGDTLAFVVNNDLTLSSICNEADPQVIGSSSIAYVDGGFVFSLQLQFNEQIALPYVISNAVFADFTDPVTQRMYPSLQGRVNAFTTPTNLETEETVLDITSWATPPVDVVLEVLE